MFKYIKILLALAAAVVLTRCHSIPDYDNDALGNFDALWSFVDSHYCFFDQKDIDWNEIRDRYRPQAAVCKDQRQLFNVMAAMLDELRDGHVNLSSWFQTSYYRKWWSDYPQNYDERLIQQYYFDFEYRSLGVVDYGILRGHNVGYLRIPTFSSGLGDSNIDAIFDYFKLCSGIIIDVRDNGGGELTNVETYVRRFITEPITAGYMVHKTGPGHDDFSEPYAYTYSPVEGRTAWVKPVVVLTNRSTFSAANNFVSIMKSLPNVTVVGDVTGGGSGMPLSSELPIGWGIRISACRILDPEGHDTEFGIAPDEGWKVDMDTTAAQQGVDTMLETAIRALIR